MQGLQQQHTNGHGNGSNGQQEPRDELDMYSQILSPPGGNPLLENSELGQGNYDENYLWQQIRSYRKGLYAYIAFSRHLSERALYETKIKLAREGFAHWSDDKGRVEEWKPLKESDVDERESTWTAERRQGDEIWAALGNNKQPLSEKQAAALLEKTGLPDEFVPVFWQMASGRHEMSRSLNAELLRDMLTGIKHLRSDGDDAADQLLGGS